MDCEDEVLFHNTELPNKSFCFFQDKKKEFCDITVKVGERSISAHRIILSAAIPYFYKEISNKETSWNSEETSVSFPDIDSDALELFIEFAYSGKIKINQKNARALLSAGCQLQVDEVRNACCSFLVDRFLPDNVLNIREYASTLDCLQLVESADCYIREHFDEVSQTTDFLNISYPLLLKLIRSDTLNVKSVENIFESTMKWIKYCPGERTEKLPELLNCIHLSDLEASYIRNHVLKEELIRTSTECRDILDETMFNHFLPRKRECDCSYSTTPLNFGANDHKRKRVDNQNSSSIYIMCCNMLQCLNFTEGKWNTKMNHSFGLSYECTATELNKKMYCFLPNVTYIWDLEKNVFAQAEGMITPRTFARSVSYNNKLYICGGCCGGWTFNSPSNIVECFDPKTEEWVKVANMYGSRTSPGVVASSEFMYVLGGGHNESNSALRTGDRYNFKTDEWNMVTSMLTRRTSPGCAILRDKIYVCGGSGGYLEVPLNTAEMFDPVEKKWNFIYSMRTPRYLCNLVSYCDKLYLIGGRTTGGEEVNTVEIYEPERDVWDYGPPTKEGSIIVGAAVVSLSPV